MLFRSTPGEALQASGMLAAEGGGLLIPKSARRAFAALQDITDLQPRKVLLETKMREVLKRSQEMQDVYASQLILQRGVEGALREIARARKAAQELGMEELKGVTRAARDSQFEAFMANVLKREPRQLSGRNASLRDGLKREIEQIGKEIRRERSLSNKTIGRAHV